MRNAPVYRSRQASLAGSEAQERCASSAQLSGGVRHLQRSANRIFFTGVALLSVLLTASVPGEATAQCAGLPSLTASPTHCDSLIDCSLELMISSAGYEIGSFSARIESTGAVSCGDTCDVGPGTSGGFCFILSLIHI